VPVQPPVMGRRPKTFTQAENIAHVVEPPISEPPFAAPSQGRDAQVACRYLDLAERNEIAAPKLPGSRGRSRRAAGRVA